MANQVQRTWEEAIKFDSGLTIGTHCVTLSTPAGDRVALIEITKRGIVKMLAKPNGGDMYSSWVIIRGDAMEHPKSFSVIVWGARNPELMRSFDNPVATIRKGVA